MHIVTCTLKTIQVYDNFKSISQESFILLKNMFILLIDGGATKSALKKYKNGGQHIVTPHGLTDNFVGSFKPIRIHKISTY